LPAPKWATSLVHLVMRRTGWAATDSSPRLQHNAVPLYSIFIVDTMTLCARTRSPGCMPYLYTAVCIEYRDTLPNLVAIFVLLAAPALAELTTIYSHSDDFCRFFDKTTGISQFIFPTLTSLSFFPTHCRYQELLFSPAQLLSCVIVTAPGQPVPLRGSSNTS
jgi:hypothetical protein